MWLVAFYDYVCSHPDLVVIGFKEAGIVDALENGVVALPQHDKTLSNGDETEDSFLDILSDSDQLNPLSVYIPVYLTGTPTANYNSTIFE